MDDERRSATGLPLTVKVTWTPEQHAAGVFLREEWVGSPGSTLWGPIPPEINPADLIAERKATIQIMMDRQSQVGGLMLADFARGDYIVPVVGDTAAIPPIEAGKMPSTPTDARSVIEQLRGLDPVRRAEVLDTLRANTYFCFECGADTPDSPCSCSRDD